MNTYRLSKMFFWAVIIACWGGFVFQGAEAARFKVLVVFSYEESYPSTAEYKEGIDAVLGDVSEIQYFFMDTKTNYEGGEQKAKEAYELYQTWQPDGVIAADDNAQAMFVTSYLQDKVKTPVMFCGVNADPEKYGYPASNVSGILERLHLGESIALNQQLDPSISKIGYIMKESPTAQFVSWQIENESETYPAESVGIKMPKTLKEAVAMTQELKEQCDLLFLVALQGLPDEQGKTLSEKEVVSTLLDIFGKPSTTCVAYNVAYGVLAAVIHRMQEQGEVAARMLLRAMQGAPVSELPITRNHQGKFMINVTTMKTLGITPKPAVLRGAELVRTE